nr:cobalamin biosynthesis protein [Hoyosella rhizosphaerae]
MTEPNVLVTRAAGIALGFALDVAVGDPQQWHPVAGFGKVASQLEQAIYRDGYARGALYCGALVGVVAAGALCADMAVRKSSVAHVALTAAATWVALGGTSLTRVGYTMAAHVEAEDIESARGLLPSLCGRDPDVLDADGIARATVESLAENTSDAAIAPLVFAAVGGAPAVLAYRAVNTLDAMVGYRSEKYARFGWASARLDDVANLIPARACAAVTVLVAPPGRRRSAWEAWRSDANKHPSPNAGVVEASAAGALGVQLGGETVYRHGREQRPTLGTGPTPGVHDVRRATRLSSSVQVTTLGVVLLSTLAVAAGQSIFRRRRAHRGSFGRRR